MPQFVVSYDVNKEADAVLKAECIERGWTDCVGEVGKQKRLPATTLLTIADSMEAANKNFNDAVAATKAEMGKQGKKFDLEKKYIARVQDGRYLSNEDCKR